MLIKYFRKFRDSNLMDNGGAITMLTFIVACIVCLIVFALNIFNYEPNHDDSVITASTDCACSCTCN